MTEISKDWCMNMAALEGDQEIGAGALPDPNVELIARLKRELAARAIRTMGPRSPYWNCTMCGAANQTPVQFRHKVGCLLAYTPNPPVLVPESAHKHFHSIEVQNAEMIAALRDIEFIVDGKEDADDGIPNDAMNIMAIVQTTLRKIIA